MYFLYTFDVNIATILSILVLEQNHAGSIRGIYSINMLVCIASTVSRQVISRQEHTYQSAHVHYSTCTPHDVRHSWFLLTWSWPIIILQVNFGNAPVLNFPTVFTVYDSPTEKSIQTWPNKMALSFEYNHSLCCLRMHMSLSSFGVTSSLPRIDIATTWYRLIEELAIFHPQRWVDRFLFCVSAMFLIYHALRSWTVEAEPHDKYCGLVH